MVNIAYIFVLNNFKTSEELESAIANISTEFGKKLATIPPFDRISYPSGAVEFSTSFSKLKIVKVPTLTALYAVQMILDKFQYTTLTKDGAIAVLPVDRYHQGPLRAFGE